MQRIPYLALAALALSACATAPKALRGEFAASTPQQDNSDGSRVRWGGSIISVEPQPERTCFQVLGRELGDSARPRRSDESAGRFLACRKGFYDPAVFTQGREITITGTVAGNETRRIGEFDYPLPKVDADVVYLWPERSEYYYDARYAAPSFWWSPGWYGWYYRPHHHWYGPRSTPQKPDKSGS